MSIRRGLLLLAIPILAACGGAADAPTGEPAVVLSGARLIDGTGGDPIDNAIIVIRGERIEMVGPAASVTVPAEAEVIDLTGKFIMPPIINLHGHVAQTIGLRNSVLNFTEENVRDKLNLYAQYGVLHVLSQGNDQPIAYDIRRRQREGQFPGALLYTAGRGFGVPGGYPPHRPDAGPDQDAHRLTSPDSIRAAVRAVVANDPEFVKMWVDHQFGTLPRFQPEAYQALIDEAHAAGVRVGAHIHTLEDAHALIDSGVDGLLHSVRDAPVDQALIDKMLERDIFSLATLVREESMFAYAGDAPYLSDPFLTNNLPSDVLETLTSEEYQAQQRANTDVARWQAILRTAQQNLKTLYDAGVRIGFGSDSGPPGRFEGYFEHREMELMEDAGLTPAQIIQIASRNSAEVLGIENDYGTVEAGKMAEFLILGADPLQDISNTKTLEQVWQRGQRIF